MIPIIKNITVVDENGIEYEPTYLRRAQGLVKHGRARFVADNKICLTRSPGNITEDNLVSDNNNLAGPGSVNPTAEHVLGIAKNMVEEKQKDYLMSIEYIMSKIDQILEDKQYIIDTIGALEKFQNNESLNGGMGDEAKARALGDIVRTREATNQQMLKVFEKVIDYHIGKSVMSLPNE